MIKEMTQEEFDKICKKHNPPWPYGVENNGKVAVFKDVSLRNVNIIGRHLDRAKFFNVVFPHYVADSSFQSARFEDCLLKTHFECCNLFSVVFHKVNLCGSSFTSYTRLDESKFEGSNLSKVLFLSSSLAEVEIADDCDMQKVRFYNCNLSAIDIGEPVYCMGPIGKSKFELISFFAKRNFVQFGHWNNGDGGTLEEFKKYIEKIYPRKNKEYRKYREQCLSAISFFKRMRKLYLAEKEQAF